MRKVIRSIAEAFKRRVYAARARSQPFSVRSCWLAHCSGDFARRARELGVNYVGGCCGCQGAHIRQMARALGKMPTEEREWAIDYEHPQSATEAYKQVRERAGANAAE